MTELTQQVQALNSDVTTEYASVSGENLTLEVNIPELGGGINVSFDMDTLIALQYPQMREWLKNNAAQLCELIKNS